MIGSTRWSYSPKMDGHRITLRSVRLGSSSMTSTVRCCRSRNEQHAPYRFETDHDGGSRSVVLAELSEQHDNDDVMSLVQYSHSLQAACHRHGDDFRYEKHGNRNAVKYVNRSIKIQIICFSTCFSSVEAETADDWRRSFSFAWNQLP